jgi:hypothetical protein
MIGAAVIVPLGSTVGGPAVLRTALSTLLRRNEPVRHRWRKRYAGRCPTGERGGMRAEAVLPAVTRAAGTFCIRARPALQGKRAFAVASLDFHGPEST